MTSPEGGEIRPDLRAARLTIGNVTVPVTMAGDTTLNLSPEQMRRLVGQVQRALLDQVKRHERRKGHGDDEDPAPEA